MGRRRLDLAGARHLLDGGDLVVDMLQLALEPVDFAPFLGHHRVHLLDDAIVMGEQLYERGQSYFSGHVRTSVGCAVRSERAEKDGLREPERSVHKSVST